MSLDKKEFSQRINEAIEQNERYGKSVLIHPDNPQETLISVSAMLSFLDEIKLRGDFEMSGSCEHGLGLIYSMMRNAIEYEINRDTINGLRDKL